MSETKLAEEAALPPGVLNIVTGPGDEVGAAIAGVLHSTFALEHILYLPLIVTYSCEKSHVQTVALASPRPRSKDEFAPGGWFPRIPA